MSKAAKIKNNKAKEAARAVQTEFMAHLSTDAMKVRVAHERNTAMADELFKQVKYTSLMFVDSALGLMMQNYIDGDKDVPETVIMDVGGKLIEMAKMLKSAESVFPDDDDKAKMRYLSGAFCPPSMTSKMVKTKTGKTRLFWRYAAIVADYLGTSLAMHGDEHYNAEDEADAEQYRRIASEFAALAGDGDEVKEAMSEYGGDGEVFGPTFVTHDKM